MIISLPKEILPLSVVGGRDPPSLVEVLVLVDVVVDMLEELEELLDEVFIFGSQAQLPRIGNAVNNKAAAKIFFIFFSFAIIM